MKLIDFNVRIGKKCELKSHFWGKCTVQLCT